MAWLSSHGRVEDIDLPLSGASKESSSHEGLHAQEKYTLIFL